MRLLWLLAVALLASSAQGAAEPEGPSVNAIVAIVNNEPVTKLEVDALVAEFFRDATNVPPEEYRATWEKAREALIENKLLIQEARRRNVEVKPEEVNEEVERLKRAKVEAESRRDMIRERLMVSHMLAMLYTARGVTPEEIAEYYEKHPDEFVLRERRNVFLIVVRARDFNGGKEAARKQAQEILDALKKGEDFATLAKRYSKGPFAEKGGDQGWMEKGALLPALDDVVSKLKAGECSGLIEDDDGFKVLKVASIQPASRQPLAEARPAIERQLQAQERQKRRNQLIERLRAEASIIRLDVYPKTKPAPEAPAKDATGERK